MDNQRTRPILADSKITQARSQRVQALGDALEDDEKLTQVFFVSGQNRKMWIINEPGLYHLIEKSRKSEAKAFKRWMRHDLVKFDFNGNDITVITDENENPWWVAKEVCNVLGYANSRKAVSDHCKYPKLLKSNEPLLLDIPSRGLTIIPESDLYLLIMGSRLPGAEEFKAWVTEDVLPSIRKTGFQRWQNIGFMGIGMTNIQAASKFCQRCPPSCRVSSHSKPL